MRFLLSFWYIGIFYLYEHELQVPIHDQRETMYTDRDRERGYAAFYTRPIILI